MFSHILNIYFLTSILSLLRMYFETSELSSIKKVFNGLIFKSIRGTSFFTFNMIPLPLESRSNLQEVLNHSIKKISFGNISSILVSETIKVFILSLTWVVRNSNLFLIKFIFKWAKISLFTLLIHTVFSVMRHPSWFFAVRSSLKLHSSTLAFELSYQFFNGGH